MIKALVSCFRYPVTLIRSAIIGTIVGAIPAAGGTLAAFTSYAEAKRASKHPETFGTGDVEGVVAPETANNILYTKDVVVKDGIIHLPLYMAELL